MGAMGTVNEGRAGGPAGVDPEEAGLTLRERKKRRTRQRISGEATRLFIERGFEQVTVAEVATAAEVSAMTVFNYFPRKEDLFLDRVPEAAGLLVHAVRDRGPGEAPLAALRRLATGLLASGHPLAQVGEGFGSFWRTVLDSPALRARGREVLEELEELLAVELGRATGAAPGDPEPRLAAALIAAGWRAAYATAVRRQLDGDPAEAVAVEQAEVLERTFDALERALPVLGGERRPG